MENFLKYRTKENLLADCIRVLSLEAIYNAKSGHFGMALGMADIMTVLFKDFLVFNSEDPNWFNRDRLIISNGHGSILLYSLLFLSGYKEISIEDIKSFRKINSKLSGHPEYNLKLGIEATTGALGQGLSNAVGIALAEKINQTKIGHDILNHKVYCTVGDGCLMEGISQESISFAANYGLDNLIVIFDDNEITIDGDIKLSNKENQVERFIACGWDVIEIDGHDTEQIKNAFRNAISSKTKKPTLISAKTIIGFGNFQNFGTNLAHGSLIKEESIKEFKDLIKFKNDPFYINEKMLTEWRSFFKRNTEPYKESNEKLKQKGLSSISFSDLQISEILNRITFYKKDLLLELQSKESTRKSLNSLLENISHYTDPIIYGSADLGSSTMIKCSASKDISSKSYMGNYINFGIREHSMSGISNGISLYSSNIPIISTFLVFADYMKSAIRMSALMKKRVIYLFTHDSIGVGEDGPTHQPIEQIDMLRSIPNLLTLRPCDAVELTECYSLALENKNGPSVIILSRQDISQSRIFLKDKLDNSLNLTSKGGYIIHGFFEDPRFTIISSGSEIEIAIEAAKKLIAFDFKVNVVSMPCFSLFESQSSLYKKSTIIESSIVIGIEASNSKYYDKYLSKNGFFCGISSFGESGNYKELYEKFELTSEKLFEKIKKIIVNM